MSELTHKIQSLFDEYIEEHGEEPIFAEVSVQYPNEPGFDVVFKLFSDVVETEDDQIFYYCDSLNDLFACCDDPVGDDFKIIGISCFFSSL